MTINRRIREIKIHYFGNVRGNHKMFIEKVGAKSNEASNWMKDGYSVGNEVTNRILAAFPQVSRGWLLTGEGNMIKDNTEFVKAIDFGSSTLDIEMFHERDFANNSINAYEVPLIPVSAAGGSLSGFYVQVMGNDYEKIISPIKDVDFALTVTGDSMSPEYPSGAKILIKKINERAFIDWGRTYVLDTVNGVVIKNIYPTDDPNRVICRSINKDYPDFELSLSSDVTYGIYRVLLCFSLK